MKSKYILALDQGTTSSRAIIFDHEGIICSQAQKEIRQIFPNPGWVEHDPIEIWSSQLSVISEAVARLGIELKEIAGIGIANQRETTILWSKVTGKPVYNAIVWQDHRTSGICNDYISEGKSDLVKSKTGLEIDAYFSATKILWILDNVEGAREMADRGELAFGTVDSWLMWNLSDGKVHVTDITNASRTLLYNIHSLEWDTELLELFNIPEQILPNVKENTDVFCYTSARLINEYIPVCGVAGDQQAAMFGQMCIKPGMIKNTYGTGCFLMVNTGSKPVKSENRLITTVAWKINGEITYALEGSVFVAGAVIQWLRDKLGIIKTAKESEQLAASVESTNGVYFVPAFTGLGAPYWNPEAEGVIYGITRGTTDAHIIRAALESIAFQSYDVIKAMEKDIGSKIQNLRADGGAAENSLLLQFQTDILNIKVERPRILETTALGAAYFAGLSLGYWKSTSEIVKQWKADKKFRPGKNSKDKEILIDNWHKVINKL